MSSAFKNRELPANFRAHDVIATSSSPRMQAGSRLASSSFRATLMRSRRCDVSSLSPSPRLMNLDGIHGIPIPRRGQWTEKTRALAFSPGFLQIARLATGATFRVASLPSATFRTSRGLKLEHNRTNIPRAHGNWAEYHVPRYADVTLR